MELDINKFKEGCKTFTKNLRQILHNKITTDHPHSKNVSSGSSKGLLEDCQRWYDENYKRVCVLLSEEYNNLIDKSDIFVDRIAEEDRRDFASQVVLVDEDIKDFNRIMADIGSGEMKTSLFIHDVRKIMYEGEVESVFGRDKLEKIVDEKEEYKKARAKDMVEYEYRRYDAMRRELEAKYGGDCKLENNKVKAFDADVAKGKDDAKSGTMTHMDYVINLKNIAEQKCESVDKCKDHVDEKDMANRKYFHENILKPMTYNILSFINPSRMSGKTEAIKSWENTIGQKSYSLDPCDAGDCKLENNKVKACEAKCVCGYSTKDCMTYKSECEILKINDIR